MGTVFGLVRVLAKIMKGTPSSLKLLNHTGCQGRGAEQKEGQEDLA
jgi:hypothetical protein